MSSIRDKVEYSRANSDHDSSESLLSDEERHVRQPERRPTFWRRVLRLLPYILGTLLACFFAGLVGFFMRHDVDGVCASHTSQHCELSLPAHLRYQLTKLAPMLDMITYHEQPFNGSFLKENVFRKDPGPEVDAAWASLGTECSFFPHTMHPVHNAQTNLCRSSHPGFSGRRSQGWNSF